MNCVAREPRWRLYIYQILRGMNNVGGDELVGRSYGGLNFELGLSHNITRNAE